MRVVVELLGGCPANVEYDEPSVEVVVIDTETEGIEDDRLDNIPRLDEFTADVSWPSTQNASKKSSKRLSDEHG